MNFDEHLNKTFSYKAQITEVYDGDTVTCNIQLGMDVVLSDQKIRLFGIAAPEITGSDKERGKLAKEFLKQHVQSQTVDLYTIKDKKEKYGRWLGILVKDGVVINKLLIDSGHATVYVL